MTAPARNLVPRPAFRAGSSTAPDPWVKLPAGISVAVADNASSPTGARLGFTHNPAQAAPCVMVKLEGETWTPGKQYALTASVFRGKAYRAWLMPGPSYTLKAYDNGTEFAPANGTGYTMQSATLTTPAADYPWGGGTGAPAEVWLAIGGVVYATMGIACARVDAIPTSYPGYFDGSTTDTSEWTFTWDAAADASASTATPPGGPDPDPDPDPDPGDDPDPWDEWDELTTRLAPRVAAYVGRPGDADVTATASAQLPVVAEYVRGYTRGRGFEEERPAAPLRAVIVAATARLATNPEQVSVFTTGDYSERPAILAGWTLTELGVLRRYRRTSA